MAVRTSHCTAARKASKAGFGPISQLDMVLTQFGFMGFGLLAPEKLGLSGSPEEQEGFIHFWRTVGHLLGIEDRSGISAEAPYSSKKSRKQRTLSIIFRIQNNVETVFSDSTSQHKK